MRHKKLLIAFTVWLAAVVTAGIWGGARHQAALRQRPFGVLEVERLRDMYRNRLFDDVLAQCDRAELDQRCVAYLPQILYVRWAANCRLGKSEDGARVCSQFLQQFPDHILGADMRFATATNALAAGDYAVAEAELALIECKYPSASVTRKASNVRSRLRTAASTVPVGR